jgi:uncharacterized integral membrane protein
MEAICSSETSVDTQRTTRRCIPEDGTLHNNRSVSSLPVGEGRNNKEYEVDTSCLLLLLLFIFIITSIISQ